MRGGQTKKEETPLLDHGVDRYLGRILAAPNFERDLRPRQAMCNCLWANKAAGRANHWANFAAVTPNKDGTCPHCGYYAVLKVVEIAGGE